MDIKQRISESNLKYNVKNIYNRHTQIYILLDYNSSYMFRSNCRAIFRFIFEQVECTIKISLKMVLQLGRNM
jgi:hypothetical protein